MEAGKGDIAVASLAFTSPGTDMQVPGWSLVGTAEVSVTLFPPKELLDNKIAALRSELQLTRANAQVKVEELEGKINSLLALPNLSEPESEFSE
jgi:hypothetical protein